MIMLRTLGVVALIALPGVAQADWYVGGALGRARENARDFRFNNPVGAGPANLNIGGQYIPMNNVSDRDNATTWSLRTGLTWAGSPWRAEVDFTRRGRTNFSGFADFRPVGGANTQQDLRVRSDSFLLMGYYDHAIDRDWGIYGGAGLGLARNRS